MVNNYDQNLLLTIKDRYKELYSPSHYNNKKSSKKVDKLHYAVHRHLNMELNDSNYEIHSKIIDGKEKNIEGFYFSKKTDIAIFNKKINKIVATVEFKWLLSSVQKNTQNSLANIIGEATNIRKTGIKTYWIFCVRNETPVYKDSGEISKLYRIDKNYLDKFVTLYKNNSNSDENLPNALSLNITNDNVVMKGLKNKRDLEIEYDNLSKDDNLYVSFDEDFNLQINRLYVNNYNNFIKEICEDIKNDK